MSSRTSWTPGVALSIAILGAGGCVVAGPLVGALAGWAVGRGADHYIFRESPTATFAASGVEVLQATALVLISLRVSEFVLHEAEGNRRQVITAFLPYQGHATIEILSLAPALTKVIVTATTKPLSKDLAVSRIVLDRIAQAVANSHQVRSNQ